MIGVIGKKVGMTQIFDETGRVVPVTVVQVVPNVVVSKKTAEKDGYNAVVVGVYEKKKSRVTKPYAGQFPEGIAPTRILREFRDFEKEVDVGQSIDASVLDGVRFVDVIAKSKGKGFQGVVKRWGFEGGRATHGSKFHREPGSTGNSTYPHHSFKNIKMPGHMGNERVTVQNLKVVRVDAEKGVVLIRGALPGPRNCDVLIRKSVKKS
ncbi:MAG: 50S ribosomal protein L3 [Rectinema subterraneum]|jgi:large subunit ribosomal protein L3|uniref:Large ribosomal subunit protein uL3 n=1 Tax=uncultured spirochete TaxID=156406 RepID=A0A3P3XJW2_9SPIR|nr:50S ribosomal protein L3 [Rectinema subterraneum]SLM14185.1 50S ribosomal subunit protein L3 [uncultured spirochete]HBE46390.1 50S ribosomal protein L3 [Spirochaetaceae bacterium]